MKENHLATEKSPYLQQHKNNPVAWYPWGEEAFTKARLENKPIFLSIGYSTCYWCHMMEKDSFEHDDLAEILNANFVSIKVDREERPDVDKIYMDAVVAITGHGGWPMSVFLTPELKPFYGGTFFWKEQFKSLLTNIANIWEKESEKIIFSSEQLTRAISQKEETESSKELDHELSSIFLRDSMRSFDKVNGGFGQAPKFPPSSRLQALLRIYDRTKDEAALHIVTKTLDAMAYGGIYDHLAGGFSRYSTDESWLVPHFEKMLYDNALLAKTYLEACLLTKNESYKAIACETLDYLIRDMQFEEGGFYSAEDAGEVGKEGEYYVWSEEEIKSLLTEDEFLKIKETYTITSSGNFEGKNILSFKKDFSWDIKKDGLVKSASSKLHAARSKRIAPHKDTKILTEWNALTISALALGFEVTKNHRYLEAAKNAADFILGKLLQDNELYRRFAAGEVRHAAVLDDYAYTIEALINLHQVSKEERFLLKAFALQEKQDLKFWDEASSCYFYSTASDSSLIIRQKELHDGATPSGSAVAILNLLRLHQFGSDQKHKDRASKMLAAISQMMKRSSAAFSQSIIALEYFLSEANNFCKGGRCELL